MLISVLFHNIQFVYGLQIVRVINSTMLRRYTTHDSPQIHSPDAGQWSQMCETINENLLICRPHATYHSRFNRLFIEQRQ